MPSLVAPTTYSQVDVGVVAGQPAQVALELERLRGAVDTGFSTPNGRLDLSLQRTDQTEKDIDDLEQSR